MSVLGRRGIHYFQKLNSANIPSALIEKGQNRVIEASLTLIRERAKLKVCWSEEQLLSFPIILLAGSL